MCIRDRGQDSMGGVGVQCAGGFIAEQNFGVRCQCAGNGNALLLDVYKRQLLRLVDAIVHPGEQHRLAGEAGGLHLLFCCHDDAVAVRCV